MPLFLIFFLKKDLFVVFSDKNVFLIDLLDVVVDIRNLNQENVMQSCNVDVVRDLKQVQNTMHQERVKARLGDDEIYHLIELKEETNFIQDIVISPFPIVTCFSEGKNCNILFLIQYVRTYYL